MARDTGSYTLSNPPVVDPAQTMSATATNNTTAAVITYTTASAHNLKVGQSVITKDFSNAFLNYNPDSGVGNGTPAVVAAVTSPTVFTVKLPAVVATASSAVAGTVIQSALVSNSPYGNNWLPTSAITNVAVAREWANSFPIQPNDDRDADAKVISTATSANNITTYTTGTTAHGLVAGDNITITGALPAAYNGEELTVIAAPTTTTITVNKTVGVAYVSGGKAVVNATLGGGSGDAYWAKTRLYPSTALDPALDNHDRVTNSDSGYPEFAPAAVVPNVVGLTMSNAIQKLRASGLNAGNVGFSADIAVTAVSTTATKVTYTTGTTAHNLGIGDTVNLSGGSVAAHNLGDVRVGAVSGFTFTVNTPGVTGTVGTDLVARPKNTVVSAQDPAAGSSIAYGAAEVVGITRNYGI